MDRKYYVEIFQKADEYIVDNPDVIKWPIDIILKKLDDGTKEMISLRWGVMARATMHSIHCFQIENLLNDLKRFSDSSYLCGFVGYLLQTEKEISLIELLVEAYKKNCVNDILPYIIAHISYEKVFEYAYHDIVLEIVSSKVDESNQYRFFQEYSKLIVEKGNIEYIVDRYIQEPTKINESLMRSIAYWLFPTEKNKAKDIMCKLGEHENQHFSNSIVDLLRQSVKYDNQYFDEFFDIVCKFVAKKAEIGQPLISLFVAYLENLNEGIHREEVYNWLMKVQEGSLVEKIALINEFHFRPAKSVECKSILRVTLLSNFEKNEQILDSADMYLAYVVKENYTEGFSLLKQIFEVNCFNSYDYYFEKMPYTCSALAENRICILEDAIKNILKGTEKELYFAIQGIVTFYDIALINSILREKKLSDQDLVRIVEGVFLFSIEAEKVCELAFELFSYAQDKDFYYSRCKDIVYGNYPGTFIDKAKLYTNDLGDSKYVMASKILKHHEIRMDTLKISYSIKDLQPSEKRTLIYRKAQYEQQRQIRDEATSKSIVSFFKTEKLKFGKRHAIIQTVANDERSYQVLNFVVNEFEMELPKEIMNHPVKQYLMKTAYLEGRKDDEINN